MEQLSGLDSFMLYDEQGNVYNHVSTLGIYDPATAPNGRTRYKEVLQHFKNRLADFPVFRRRLVTVPYGLDRPYWVEDREVDIEFHVRHIALPHPGDWRQLMIQVARLHSRPLDRNKPLWEIYVIDGLDKIPGLHSGCFALFLKLHHAAVDGQPAATLMEMLHSDNPHEVLIPPHQQLPQSTLATPSSLELLGNVAKNTTRRALGLSSLYLASANKLGHILWNKLAKPLADPNDQQIPSAPLTRFNHPVSANRVIEAVALPLSEVKRVRQTIPGISTNDIFLCVCAGALRKYLERHGELPDDSLRTLMPFTAHDRTVMARQHRGNSIAGAPVALRTDIDDAVERLRALRHESNGAKRTAEVLGLDLLQGLLDNLPGIASRVLLRQGLLRNINVATSYVRGPEVPLYVAGARLLHFYPVGIATDHLGLNMTAFSYNGVLWISTVACRNMLPDSAFFAECLRSSFAELLEATQQLAQSKPAPVLLNSKTKATSAQPAKIRAKPLPSSKSPTSPSRRPRVNNAAQQPPEVEPLQ